MKLNGIYEKYFLCNFYKLLFYTNHSETLCKSSFSRKEVLDGVENHNSNFLRLQKGKKLLRYIFVWHLISAFSENIHSINILTLFWETYQDISFYFNTKSWNEVLMNIIICCVDYKYYSKNKGVYETIYWNLLFNYTKWKCNIYVFKNKKLVMI